jgi:pimeloyl-ACP methyl ester carboxylesterase
MVTIRAAYKSARRKANPVLSSLKRLLKRFEMKLWMIIVIILVGVGVAFSALTLPGYMRDIHAARERLRSLGSKVIDTACGPIEYATIGEGSPVLVVHGVVGGYDQGLTVARANVGEGFRIIAPSRFGYQGTPVPSDTTPAAQADAHACLLDALNIHKAAVVGISAGAPSSIQFALRHADRISAMVLLVPSAYTPHPPDDVQSVAFPFILGAILKSSFPVWAAMKANPSTVLSTMGVPPSIQARLAATDKEEIMQWLLPYDTRIKGTIIDGKIASALERYPLEKIAVPTLVISAKDDLWKTYEAARYTAQNIPGAKFVGFDSGGHLLNGYEAEVLSEVSEFLRQHTSYVPQIRK